ncbi:MAG: hypothetical protein Q4C96_09640, partial [Planctomycetia bacterium]|nr:hypothetical protein [Planctomycetia bacterium]
MRKNCCTGVIHILAAFLTALFIVPCAQAEVSYSNGTFTGDGEYTADVEAGSSNLTATPTTGKSMTLSGDITTTGAFQHSSLNNSNDTLILSGDTNSFGSFSISGHATTAIEGKLEVTGQFGVGSAQTSTVVIRGESASLTVGGNFYVGQARNAQGIVNQQNGTVSLNTSAGTGIRIGHWTNSAIYPSKYNLSGGELNIPNTKIYVGWDAYGELNITGGTANLYGIQLNHNTNTNGVLTLRGGTLNLGAGNVYKTHSNHSILLGQGTISLLDSATSTEWGGGLTVTLDGRSTESTADDSSGYTKFHVTNTTNVENDTVEQRFIYLRSVLTGVGGIYKTGDGTLVLDGDGTLANYLGTITAKEGVVTISKALPTSEERTVPFVVIDGGTVNFTAAGATFSSPEATPWTFAQGGGTLTFTGNIHPLKSTSQTIKVNGVDTVDDTNPPGVSVITGNYNTNGSHLTLDVGANRELNYTGTFYQNNVSDGAYSPNLTKTG